MSVINNELGIPYGTALITLNSGSTQFIAENQNGEMPVNVHWVNDQNGSPRGSVMTSMPKTGTCTVQAQSGSYLPANGETFTVPLDFYASASTFTARIANVSVQRADQNHTTFTFTWNEAFA